jgi:enoyl-CoA hydratase
MESSINFEKEGPIGKVILNRPNYRNAQSRELLERLDETFSRAVADDDVKVIILMATGDHFCAGHDLGTPEELEDQKNRPIAAGIRGRYDRSRDLYVDFTLKWRDIPKPTIAIVQGYCIFAGWMIASAMDMIFAAKDAMFLGTNFQYFSIPWDMNPRKAKELLFESRFINGIEAEKLELVNRTYDKDALLSQTLGYANRVAENDSFQLKMIKLAVNQMQETQGFKAHINSTHTMHLLSATAETDPGYELKQPEGRRRPMVQKAIENYQRHQSSPKT